MKRASAACYAGNACEYVVLMLYQRLYKSPSVSSVVYLSVLSRSAMQSRKSLVYFSRLVSIRAGSPPAAMEGLASTSSGTTSQGSRDPGQPQTSRSRDPVEIVTTRRRGALRVSEPPRDPFVRLVSNGMNISTSATVVASSSI